MPNLLTPLPFLDASGQPANGFIFAQATRTFSTAGGFITTARSMGRVVNGVFLTADDSKSDPFVLVTATVDAPLSIVIKLDSYTTDGRLVPNGGGVASRTVTVPDVGTVTWLDLVDVVAVADAVPYVIQPWMQDAMDNAAAASASAATATTKASEAAASAASIVRGGANGVAPLDASSLLPEANVPVRLTEGQLSTTIDAATAPVGVGVTVFGDSISAANAPFDVSAGVAATPAFGYLYQANVHLRNSLRIVSNQGVSGNTTAQMLARVQAVIDDNPDVVVMLGGTNDILAGVSSATTIANLSNTIAALLAGGVRLIALGTVPPSTSYDTATEKMARATINDWVRKQGRDNPRVVPVMWDAPLTNPTDGLPRAGVLYDGIHPNGSGAAFMGKALANALARFVPDLADLSTSNADPRNVLTQGMMLGDTSGLANGVTVNAGTNVYAASKVARTDGAPGEWQQVNLTSGTVELVQARVIAGGPVAIGDTAQLLVEVDTDNDVAALSKIEIFLRARAGAGGSYQTIDQSGGLVTAYVDTGRPQIIKGVIASEPLVIPADTADLVIWFRISGAGTIRTSRWTVRKVS